MAQIKKKFLASNAVDGSKVQFSNNEAFRVKSSSGTDVELFKLDGSNLFQFLQLPRVGSDPTDGSDIVRKSYLDSEMATEVAARIAADLAEQAAREAAVSAEQTRAEAAEAALQAAIDALDVGNTQALADEVAARQAADADLQSQVNTEKGRIDAILLASDADKNSFAEIVNLINSVDTTNDNAFASYVLSNNAALAQEVSDRTAGDSTLQSNLDAEQARAEAAEGVLQGNINAEQAAREAADADLQSQIDNLEIAASGDVSLEQAARIAADAAEAAARQAADADLQSQINNILSNADPAALDSLSEVVAAFQSADGDLNSAISALGSSASSALAQETAARQAADSAETSARQAADAQEVADRQAAVSAEASAREAADAAEAAAREAQLPRFAKMATTLTSTDISNGYVDLVHCVKPESVHVYIDRDRKSTRLNSSHVSESRMPSSA